MKQLIHHPNTQKSGSRSLLKSAVALMLTLCVFASLLTGCGKPDDPSISGTTPTGTSATTPSTNPATEPDGSSAPTDAVEPTTVPGESTTPPEADESKPTEPKPTEPKPTEPKPTEPKPTEPKPTEPKPTEPVPTEPAPTEPQGGSNYDPSKPFVPTLRFVVASDVHIRPQEEEDFVFDNKQSNERLEQLYKTAYAYADAQTAYNKLDGIFFLGDNTNTGAEDQQTFFFNYVKEHTRPETIARAVMGNHEFKATGDNSAASREQAPLNFMKWSGYDAVDAHLTIGGYHFIFLSMDNYNKTTQIYFTSAKQTWLKQQLEAAVADDPTKPVFVFHHEPVKDTVIGSQGSNGDKNLGAIYAKYPQAVVFSGHSHRPLTDTRSIWQDTYTAINAGSLAYLSSAIPGHPSYSNGGATSADTEGGWRAGEDDDIRNAGMYYIVEINSDGVVRLQIYNIFTESVWGEPIILDSVNPKDFKYTNARKDAADKPVFASNTAVTVHSNSPAKASISFPQATSKDIVQSYRVELYQGSTLVETYYRLSHAYYGDAMPDRIYAYMPNLKAATQYTVKIYAVNSWSKESEPLTKTFTTAAADEIVPADVVNITFATDGSATNTVTGEKLTTCGAPAVAYDAALGKNVATFDGKDDAYVMADIESRYGALETGFTMETYVYLEKKPTKTNNFMWIFSNQETGGFGVGYKYTGDIYFYCRTSDYKAYKKPCYKVSTGQWVHIVAVSDAGSVKLYINGALVAEQETKKANATLAHPTPYSQFLVVGGDSGSKDMVVTSSTMFQGKVADAKIYSAVLTPEQIAKLYQAYQN